MFNLELTKEKLEAMISALEGNIGCMKYMGYHNMPNENWPYSVKHQKEKRTKYDASVELLEDARKLLNK